MTSSAFTFWTLSLIKNQSKENEWFYVLIMSCTHFRVLNVKELLSRNRRDIWNLSDSNGLWVCISGCGFESRCSDERILWLYRWKPLKASHNPLKFGGHRFCRSGDVTFLTSHITSYDVSKGHLTYLVGFPPWKPCPVTFSSHLSCESWDNLFFYLTKRWSRNQRLTCF